MSSLVLSRVSFPTTDHADYERQELAKRLSNELEYDGHKHKLNAAEIARKLNAINCPPFSASSVRRYKGWMELKASGLIAALGLTAFSFLALGCAVAYLSHKASSPAIGIPAFLLAVGCFIGSIGLWIDFGATDVQWHTTPLAGYDKLIPDSAAKTILRIKESFPNVGFLVEELMVRRLVKDPFVIAMIDGYVFHIAVWDEPEYTPRI